MCHGRTENKDLNQNSLMGGNNAKPIILCPDMDEEKIREIKGSGTQCGLKSENKCKILKLHFTAFSCLNS